MTLEMKVDDVRWHISRDRNTLTVWLFNDSRFASPGKRIARYDFGVNASGMREKLLKGLYRTPYRDGWKYTVNLSVHPLLARLIVLYAEYGWKTDEDGRRVPFTYLRHNRKALGIHYLIERYCEAWHMCLEYNAEFSCKEDPAFATADAVRMPYFPTPQSYRGYNPTRRIRNDDSDLPKLL